MNLKQFRNDLLPPKDLYGFKWNTDNLDKIVKLFYWCSVNDAFEWFDFEKAFRVAETVLKKKLGYHFSLDEDEQLDFMKRSWEKCYSTKVELVEMISAYLRNLSYDELKEVENDVLYFEDSNGKTITPNANVGVPWYDVDLILKPMMHDFPKFREDLFQKISQLHGWNDGTYHKIKKQYDEIKEKKWKTSEFNKEVFFDKIMHLMHHHGHIFLDDINLTIPELRKEYA